MSIYRNLFSFILLILIFTYSPTIANTDQSTPPLIQLNQTRIGVGLALEYAFTDTNLKIQPPDQLALMTNKQSQTGKHIQVAPSFEFGTTVNKDYYLGLLVSWHYSGLKTNSSAPLFNDISLSHEFKLSSYADFLVKMGYKPISPLIIYGLFGPSLTKWSHTTFTVFNNVPTNKFQINRTSLGLGIGLGFEYLFKKNYAFSFDYIYHLHSAASKSQSYTVNLPFVGPISGDVNKKVDLSYATIAVRFTMFFNL